MLKSHYASVLPTTKPTSGTLLTSLSCKLSLPASSQLRGSAKKCNPSFRSLLPSLGGSRMPKEVWRSGRASFPFNYPYNRSTHSTSWALLRERKTALDLDLQEARHQGSGLKDIIELTGSYMEPHKHARIPAATESSLTNFSPSSACFTRGDLLSSVAKIPLFS